MESQQCDIFHKKNRKMEPRNTITRAATTAARKSGLSSRCNLFLLVWQRFWLQFHVLWWLLCLSTSGNCKYSFCLSILGKRREETRQIGFERGFRRKQPQEKIQRGAPNPPHPTHYPTVSSAWAGRPPMGTTRGQGQAPETHHVLWWTPSIQQEPPTLYKINYREGYIVQHREYSQYFYNNCKRSITFKHYESLYCTCNLHNKLLVEWAFPSDDTKAPLFAGKPSANSSQTACPREQ